MKEQTLDSHKYYQVYNLCVRSVCKIQRLLFNLQLYIAYRLANHIVYITYYMLLTVCDYKYIITNIHWLTYIWQGSFLWSSFTGYWLLPWKEYSTSLKSMMMVTSSMNLLSIAAFVRVYSVLYCLHASSNPEKWKNLCKVGLMTSKNQKK